jgi:hypothetical protein
MTDEMAVTLHGALRHRHGAGTSADRQR